MPIRIRIFNLTPSACAELVALGFHPNDPASIAVPLAYGDTLQEQGDTQRLADRLGVQDDVLYQWLHRAGQRGVQRVISKRRRAKSQARAHARRVAEAQLAEAAKAWQAGVDAKIVAAAFVTTPGAPAAAGFVSRLRKRMGVAAVPYRRPDHWNRRTEVAQ